MLLACPSSLCLTSSLSGSSGCLCSPSSLQTGLNSVSPKLSKGPGTNANRGSKRSLISLGHQAKEKPHRKDDNSMRKIDFICRMAAFHCFAI